MYLLRSVDLRVNKMPSDQAPRTEALIRKQKAAQNTIPLTEKSVRMRQAECIAKGGSRFSKGVCYR